MNFNIPVDKYRYSFRLKTLFFLFAIFFIGAAAAQAATFESTGSGNWNNAATWTLTSGTDADGIPDADDDVTIVAGHTITVSDTRSVQKVTNNGALTVAAALTAASSSGNAFVNNGAITVQSGGNLTANLAQSSSASSTLTIDQGGTFTSNFTTYVNGDLTNNGTFTATLGYTLYLNGANVINNGSFGVFGKIYFSRNTSAGSMTLSGSGSFGNRPIEVGLTTGGNPTSLILALGTPLSNISGLAINSGSTFSFTGTLAVSAITLNVDGTISGNILQTNGNVTISTNSVNSFNVNTLEVLSGTLTTGTSTTNFNNVSVAAGSTFRENFTTNINGNLTNNGTITGSAAYVLALKGETVINNGTINTVLPYFNNGATTTLSGTGTITGSASNDLSYVRANTTLRLGSSHQFRRLEIESTGTLDFNSNTLLLSGSGTPLTNSSTAITNARIVYNGTAAQTVASTNVNYALLGINNAAGVTLSAAETVTEQLTLTNGAFSNGANLTLANGATIVRDQGVLGSAPTLAGMINVSYIGGANITAGNELPTSTTALNNLSINKTAGTSVALGASRTVNGTLTLTSGVFDAGANTLTVGASGAVAGGSENSYVAGALQTFFAAAQTFAFPVGTANGYSPAVFVISAAGGVSPGLIVKANEGAVGPAGQSLLRYWSVTESGDITAKPQFFYRDADVPVSVNESNFDIRRYNGATFATVPDRIYPNQNRADAISEVTDLTGNWTLVEAAPPAATDLLDGIAAWFTGDGEAKDFTRNAPDGVLSGNAGYAVGKVGQAFTFDGDGDNVEIANHPDLNPTSQMTLEFWVNPAGTAGDLVGKDGETTDRQYFIGIGNGKFRPHINTTINGLVYFDGNADCQPNQWCHVAMTFDGTALRLYVNGAADGSAEASGSIITTTQPLRIGGGAPAGAPQLFFNGKIDEVSLYNRALSASEIQNIFNADKTGKTKSVPTPAGANVSAEVTSATVTFTQVDGTGNTTQTPIDMANQPALPFGYNSTGLAWDVSTTADFSNGSARVCFDVPSLAANFGSLRIFHMENGSWVDRTDMTSTSPTLCTEYMNSLSPFAIASIAPTAASASISGRVLSPRGTPLGRVTVHLTDQNGQVRTVSTNQFGYYRFTDVEVGQSYLLNAFAKKYQFSPQVVTVNEELTDVVISAGKLPR